MESRLRRRDFSNEPSKKGMVMHTTEVDHAANARAAGLFMPETRVAFFGKPAVGTHLMLERPEVALELPLRIVISEVPGEGTMLFMPDILWLAHRYGIDPQLDSLRKTLGFMALVSDKVCGD